MPALQNPKHESFCQQIIEAAKFGRTQGQAYSRAGFKADGPSAAMAASRLIKKDHIRARLAELAAPAARRTRATVDSLAAQFDQVFDAAMSLSQLGAAGSAAHSKAKLLGYMRERLEVGGPGDFERLQNNREIAQKLVDDLGGIDQALEHIDMMRGLLLEVASEAALPVAPTMSKVGISSRFHRENYPQTRETIDSSTAKSE